MNFKITMVFLSADVSKSKKNEDWWELAEAAEAVQEDAVEFMAEYWELFMVSIA